VAQQNTQPNIIFIGLDSVRPDHLSFFNKKINKTPHVDNFLTQATVFTHAYTPLARTFPAWLSILTGKYPKHNHARSNLADPALVLENENLAKRLQANGYETFYATDEKRFSNITEQYGFDHVLGPHMGVNDFILGGLTDFPLTNLVINTALGKLLFPYNFANRAAAITYEPERFLQLVQLGLQHRTKKPVFLAVHLCVTHWPFTWARDKQASTLLLPERYESSVQEVDKQLGQLLQILKAQGLLEHSLVVLLSDHGTAVGLPGDREVTQENYLGVANKMKWLPFFKLSSNENHLVLNTSYGQGTDILSLKQYHVLLAFRGFGLNTETRKIDQPVSLLDIAPTILDWLKLPPLTKIDGITLTSYLQKNIKPIYFSRFLFLETGYSLSEIETKNIQVDKVIKDSIDIFHIDSVTGRLVMTTAAEKSINKNKKRAVLFHQWLLAYYPPSMRARLAFSQHIQNKSPLQSYRLPGFYVIANLETGKWSIGLDSPMAKQAPMKKLLLAFNGFYGSELG
jgi:arylsulfatase A-like enzyme